MSELQKCYKALDALAATSTIRKNIDSSLSPQKQRAVAIAKATKTPAGAALARRIMELEKAEAMGLGYGLPLAKSQSFSHENGPIEAFGDDELLQELEEIRERADKIRDELVSRGYEEEA